jgi:hypothetical protein
MLILCPAFTSLSSLDFSSPMLPPYLIFSRNVLPLIAPAAANAQSAAVAPPFGVPPALTKTL